jgi:hypothetical protein
MLLLIRHHTLFECDLISAHVVKDRSLIGCHIIIVIDQLNASRAIVIIVVDFDIP